MNDACCANHEKIMNDMTEKMIETMKENMLQRFHQPRKDDNVHKPNLMMILSMPFLLGSRLQLIHM